MASKKERQTAFDTFLEKVTAVRGAGSGYVFDFNETSSCLRDLIPALRADIDAGTLTIEAFKKLRTDLIARSPNDSTKYVPAMDWVQTNYPFSFRDADIKVMRQVCEGLLDVKIADVDFSPNVMKAAKAKMMRDGRSLYDTIKQDFDTVVTEVEKEVRMVKKFDKEGREYMKEELVAKRVDTSGVAERAPEQSKFYRDHDKAMSNAKLLSFGTQMGEDGLKVIASNVIQNRFAVCESVAATIVYQCRQRGFQGRIEWIGIPYSAKSGHAVVLAHRAGDDFANPSSWGSDWFIVDMWYYNLGMRNRYLWATKQEQTDYLRDEIADYTGSNGGLKLMASLG